MTYQERRQALDAFGVEARVWRADHAPRYEIAAGIPLDGTQPASEGFTLGSAARRGRRGRCPPGRSPGRRA
jgi:hypothetical protein